VCVHSSLAGTSGNLKNGAEGGSGPDPPPPFAGYVSGPPAGGLPLCGG